MNDGPNLTCLLSLVHLGVVEERRYGWLAIVEEGAYLETQDSRAGELTVKRLMSVINSSDTRDS